PTSGCAVSRGRRHFWLRTVSLWGQRQGPGKSALKLSTSRGPYGLKVRKKRNQSRGSLNSGRHTSIAAYGVTFTQSLSVMVCINTQYRYYNVGPESLAIKSRRCRSAPPDF